jgi:hypothetical protein
MPKRPDPAATSRMRRASGRSGASAAAAGPRHRERERHHRFRIGDPDGVFRLEIAGGFPRAAAHEGKRIAERLLAILGRGQEIGHRAHIGGRAPVEEGGARRRKAIGTIVVFEMAVDDQKVAKRADAALLGIASLGEGGDAVPAFRDPGEQVEAGCGQHGRRPEIAEDARDDWCRRIVVHACSGLRPRTPAARGKVSVAGSSKTL